MLAPTTSTTPAAQTGPSAPPPAEEILAAVVFGAQDFLNHGDWQRILDAWLERLGRATRSHRVRVFRNHTEGAGRTDGAPSVGDAAPGIGLLAEWSAPGIAGGLLADALQDISYSGYGCDRWPAVLGRGERLVGNTADFADYEQPFLRAQGMASVAIVPVFVGTEWWGFMAFGDCVAPREWSEPVLHALSAAAGILGAALARLEMEQRIEAARAREQLATEIGVVLTEQARSLEERLHRCAHSVARHLDADLVRIWHLDDNGSLLRPTPSGGRVTGEVPLHGLAVGEYAIGRVAAAAQPEVWRDGIPELWPGSMVPTEAHGLRAGAAWPLTKDDRVVGVVVMLLRAAPSPAQLDSLASITDELALAIEHSRAQNAHRRSEEHYRQLVDVTVEGIVMHDGTGIVNVNPSMARMVGYTVAEVIGTNPFDYIHPRSHDTVRRHLAENYQEPYEAELVHRSGRVFPVEIKGSDYYRDGVKVRVAAIRDITERKKAERTAALLMEERAARTNAERSRRQAELLLEATHILSSSFDTSTTLGQLAHLAARSLGDFCVVSLHGDSNAEPAAVVHAAAAKQAVLERAVDRWREQPAGSPDAARAPGGGEPFLMPAITAADLDRIARDAEHRRLLSELDPRSLMSAPITTGGEQIGSILLVSSQPGRAYAIEDLALAQELGRRAALAIQAARSYNDAMAATRARDDLLGIVAHDLRNPLNTVGMAGNFGLELIAEQPENPVRRQLEIIQRTVEHMSRLIQDLLDASRVQSGQLALERVPTRPQSIVQEALEMLQPLAAHANVQLDAEVEPGLTPIAVDRQRIVQVLSNLVGNALKFTPAGGRVLLAAEASDENVRFTVSDTGAGIPAEQLPLIFGRFWQARSDRRGLGLGLSIAKGIVETHGGSIWATSTPGAGSTFGFDLPHE